MTYIITPTALGGKDEEKKGEYPSLTSSYSCLECPNCCGNHQADVICRQLWCMAARMAEPMHRAQQSRGRCWGSFSVLFATASCTGLNLSWSMVEQIKFQSLQLRKMQMKILWRNNTEKPKLYRSWFLQTIVANARVSDLLIDLATWNFPGVYHCLLENSLGAVASTGQPRSQTRLCSTWKQPEKWQRQGFWWLKNGYWTNPSGLGGSLT